jgi:outer membrane autotransporter protein
VAGSEYIGYYGNGAFTQSGGTNTANTLFLGYAGGASGSYNQSGGSLSATYEYIGTYGTATFTQSGGTNTVTGPLTLAASGASGTYSLSGGSLAAGTVNLNAGGTFSQTGGSLSATTFNQQGGSVTAASSLQNQGTFNYYSGAFAGRLLNYGSVNFDADFTAGNGLANYSAIPLSINAGRTVTLNGAGLDNQGTLAVNGTLVGGGPLLNDTTGTLSGTGAIQGNLTNQGTVSPGTPLGTLTITGNYTQTASGTLVEQIASASSYSTLAVTGSASLNGALKVVLLNGYLPGYGQSFTGILTAPGGVSGTFNTIINQRITPTLYWKVLYGATSVGLQTGAMVARNYTIPGLTGNEWRVGNALNGVANNATGDLNTVLNAIDSLNSNSAVANALQQISADKVASLTILGFAGSDFFNRGLANRINNLRYGGPGATSGLSGLGGFNLSGSRLDGLMLAYNSSSLAGLITGKKEAGPETPWGVYLYPDMSLGSQKSSPNQTGFDFAMGGFTGGADYQVRDNLLVGLATGYGYTGANLHGSGGGVQNNTWPLNAYVAYLPKSFYAYGSLGYALNLFNLQRDIDFGGLSRSAKSSTSGNQFNAYGEAGYDLKAKSLVVTPMVSLAYSSLWVNGFTEGGAGALDLKVDPQQADSLQTGVGAKVGTVLQRNSVKVVPQIYATYQHEFSNNSRNINASLSQGSNTFAFQTDQSGKNFALLGARVNIFPKNNFSLQIDYNAEVGRDKYTSHTVSAGVRWEF